jgi:hypothetical protein
MERELAVGEVDMDIGRKQSNQANDIPTKASSRALPANPSRHQGGTDPKSRGSSSTLNSPAQSQHPQSWYIRISQ